MDIFLKLLFFSDFFLKKSERNSHAVSYNYSNIVATGRRITKLFKYCMDFVLNFLFILDVRKTLIVNFYGYT